MDLKQVNEEIASLSIVISDSSTNCRFNAVLKRHSRLMQPIASMEIPNRLLILWTEKLAMQCQQCNGAYNRIGTLPNVSTHSTVNHSVTFVDPVTGTHTQNVESYWNRCKTKLRRIKGCVAHQVPSYLNEFMWRERHGTSRRLAFTNIMRDITAQYPAP